MGGDHATDSQVISKRSLLVLASASLSAKLCRQSLDYCKEFGWEARVDIPILACVRERGARSIMAAAMKAGNFSFTTVKNLAKYRYISHYCALPHTDHIV